MKKLLLISILICVTGFSYAQNNLTTGEFAQENPELLVPSEPGIGEYIGNSIKSILSSVNYTYVGSFAVNDGPAWGTNPPCYTGQEAAALLFGGDPSDYVISTNSNTVDPNTITFTTWMNSWGAGLQEHPQDYKVDVPPTGYQFPGGTNSAISAYVMDWNLPNVNYVWSVSTVTIPVSNWAILIGLLLIGSFILIRYRRRLA